MKKYLILSFLCVAILFSGCSLKNSADNKILLKDQGTEQKKMLNEKVSTTSLPEINQENNDQLTVLKNYSNNTINISLKYPENVILSEPAADVVLFNLNGKKEYLQIQVLESTPPSSIDRYMPNGAGFMENVVIDSKNAEKYFTNSPIGEGVLATGSSFTAYIVKLDNKKWIQIGYYGDGDMGETFETIIKSIKFN